VRFGVRNTPPHVEVGAGVGQITEHVEVHRVQTVPHRAAVEDQVVIKTVLLVELKTLEISLHDEVVAGRLVKCCKGMKKN
jgi:hypothetical protein